MRYSNDLVLRLYLAGDQAYACKTDGASAFAKCNAPGAVAAGTSISQVHCRIRVNCHRRKRSQS